MDLTTRVLKCRMCGYKITDSKHRQKCTTITMWSNFSQLLSEFVNPMMTYGLGGCTAAIIKTDIKIIMAHDPDKKVILKLIQQNQLFLKKLYIRVPLEYEKDTNGKYKNKTNTIFDEIPCEKIIEFYNTSITLGNDDHSKTTLYCKNEDTSIKYTDVFGIWKNL